MVTEAMKFKYAYSLEEKLWQTKKLGEVVQSCLTLCNPTDCGLPGSSIHGIFQARVLEWVAISFSRMTNLDSMSKSWDITHKGPSSQSYCFSSNHVWLWELDHKESWAPKNWCFRTVVFEKTLESLLDCKEIKLVNPKGNQSITFIGRTDAEAETPILWPPDAKTWLSGKDVDAGKHKAGGEGDNTGWDGWMASLTQCIYVWVRLGSWWWTWKSCVL